MTVKNALYEFAWNAASLAASPAMRLPSLTRHRVQERLFPRPLAIESPFWWWHGASAGEVKGLSTLWHHVGRQNRVHAFSSCTLAGIALWESSGVAPALVNPFPADRQASWRTMFTQGSPELALVSETELWPGCFRFLRETGCPVAVVSARLSQKSAFWLRIAGLLADVAPFLFICAQTERDAERYRSIGVHPDGIAVTGSLKWQVPASADSEHVRAALGWNRGESIVVFGSVHRGEMTHVLRIVGGLREKRLLVRFIVAPRHADDYDYAEGVIQNAGFRTKRFSGGPPQGEEVVVVDRMGVLARLYAIAEVSVIGGSWVPLGGHNPFEAAVFGKSVIYGPYMHQPGTELLEASGQGLRAEDGEIAAKLITERLRAPGTAFKDALPDAVTATEDALRRWGLIRDSGAVATNK